MTPGSQWTTIWTSLPVIERLPTADPQRCVAARLDTGDAGDLVVFGTVLPWNGDVGPAEDQQGRGWDEFDRIVSDEGREWARLRKRFPEATLVVAGALNQDLGCRHYSRGFVPRPARASPDAPPYSQSTYSNICLINVPYRA